MGLTVLCVLLFLCLRVKIFVKFIEGVVGVYGCGVCLVLKIGFDFG